MSGGLHNSPGWVRPTKRKDATMTNVNLIRRLWHEAANDYPDKSTEWLFQMVCDKYQASTNQEIDHSDVAGALAPTKGAADDPE